MIEEFTEDHYPILVDWWKGHGWDPVPKQILPKLGIVSFVEGLPCAAGFVYMDNSVGVAMLEWVVTDPKVNPIKAFNGLKEVTSFLASRVKELDYGVLLTSCRQDSLSKFYQKQGFLKTDEGLTHFLKVL